MEGGNVLHHVKWRGEMSGANMFRGKCSDQAEFTERKDECNDNGDDDDEISVAKTLTVHRLQRQPGEVASNERTAFVISDLRLTP